MPEGGDEVPVEVDGLVEGEKDRVARLHLLQPGTALLRHEHVADHGGERAEPPRTRVVRAGGLEGLRVGGEAVRDDLTVAVQGQLLVQDRQLQLVRVRGLVLPELHQDRQQQDGRVTVLQAGLGSVKLFSVYRVIQEVSEKGLLCSVD